MPKTMFVVGWAEFLKVMDSRWNSNSDQRLTDSGQPNITTSTDFFIADEDGLRGRVRALETETLALSAEAQGYRQLFLQQLDEVRKQTEVLDSFQLPSGYSPHKTSFTPTDQLIEVRCGSASSAVTIELRYSAPKTRFFFWREAASLSANITFDSQDFPVPIVEISGRGQSALDVKPVAHSLRQKTEEWTYSQIVSQVAQYLVSLVDQSLDLTERLNRGLPSIDLHAKFERELIAKTARALNLPSLPEWYQKSRVEILVKGQAEQYLDQSEDHYSQFESALTKLTEKIQHLDSCLNGDAELLRIKEEYKAGLEKAYADRHAELDNQIAKDLRDEVSALEKKRSSLLAAPNDDMTRISLLNTVRQIFVDHKSYSESSCADIAGRLAKIFLNENRNGMSLDEFSSVLTVVADRISNLDRSDAFGFTSEAIASQKEQVKIFIDTMKAVARYLSPTIIESFVDSIANRNSRFHNRRISAVDMKNLVEVLLDVNKGEAKQKLRRRSDQLILVDEEDIGLEGHLELVDDDPEFEFDLGDEQFNLEGSDLDLSSD